MKKKQALFGLLALMLIVGSGSALAIQGDLIEVEDVEIEAVSTATANFKVFQEPGTSPQLNLNSKSDQLRNGGFWME